MLGLFPPNTAMSLRPATLLRRASASRKVKVTEEDQIAAFRRTGLATAVPNTPPAPLGSATPAAAPMNLSVKVYQSRQFATRVINRIRALREARGLSLEALATLVGTTNQQISHLETGKRRLTVDWLSRLGEALCCHPWTLVSDDHLSAGLGNSFPPDERLLLEAYRKLNQEQRRAVLTLLAMHKTSLSSAQTK